MQISLIIPAYNEEKRISETLVKILEFNKKEQIFSEIIVVNDGSKDATLEILNKIPSIRIISYLINKGKGEALRQGVKKAKSEWIYICDADLSSPIEEIQKFLPYLNTYDCVIGSRGLDAKLEKRSKIRSLTGKFGNFLIDFFLDLGIKDTQCGFKLFNKKAKDVFLQTQINSWGYDFEFLFQIKKQGFLIKEIPVAWIAEDTFSKVSWKSYFETFWVLIKFWRKNIGFSKQFILSIFSRYSEFFRYLIVGTLTNVLNILVFLLLIKVLPAIEVNLGFFDIKTYHVADTVNYLLTIVTLNFLLHKFWTFKSNKPKPGEFGRYLVLLVFNHFTALGILTFFVEITKLSFIVSKVISLLFVISWNFFALKLFVYRKR
jgi:dolichyl-phosphate beta-glucosyltransferase